jgi:hypothetical protein
MSLDDVGGSGKISGRDEDVHVTGAGEGVRAAA